MPSRVIRPTQAPAPAPFAYTIGTADGFAPEAVFAEWDGSGAFGDFLPCVSYYSAEGVLLDRAFPDGATLHPGDTAEVGYRPFRRGGGGSTPVIGSAYATGHLATATNPPTNQPPIIDDALLGVTSAGGEWTIQQTGLYLWWITVLLSYHNGQPAFGLIAAILGVTPALTKQIATRLSSPVAVAGGDLFGGESGIQLVTLNAGDALGVFLGTGNGASFVELRGGAVGLMRVA